MNLPLFSLTPILATKCIYIGHANDLSHFGGCRTRPFCSNKKGSDSFAVPCWSSAVGVLPRDSLNAQAPLAKIGTSLDKAPDSLYSHTKIDMDELKKALESQLVIELLNKRISRFIPEAKDYLATRNAILMAHNTIEGILNLLLSRYYLGKEKEIGDKNKVNHFWINVLTEMNFNKKLRILSETDTLEKDIIDAFDRINNIRNDVAHYPHRRYKRKDNHLLYKGKHIFHDIEGLKSFYNDFYIILTKVQKIIIEQGG